MLLLSWLACLGPDTADTGCPGEDPVALYGSQHWEGEPGVVSLVTWGGPGRVCEVACSEAWVHPGYIFEDEPCHEGRLELEHEDGDWAGLCAFIDQTATGEATCTVALPSGYVDFELFVTEADGDEA
jgi:hypothetical protein